MDGPPVDHRGATPPQTGGGQPGEHPADSKKNVCKPWRKVLWCIGQITEEYRERMYDLLGLYAKPYNAAEPVVCLDEKSKQLLEQTRAAAAGRPGADRQRRLRVSTGRDTKLVHRGGASSWPPRGGGYSAADQARFCGICTAF